MTVSTSLKTQHVSFADVWLNLPQRWRDITHTLPERSPPTLAIEDGVGALQFSVGIHVAGDNPHIDAKALEQLLYQFEDTQGFERVAKPVTWRNENVFGLCCDYPLGGEFIRVWYCSDGQNIAFLTFVTNALDDNESSALELQEADYIARSLQFEIREQEVH